jgi:hypothetical protein
MKFKCLVFLLALTAFSGPAKATETWEHGLFAATDGYTKYLMDNYCEGQRASDCFTIDKQSAIVNAIKTMGQQTYLVIAGERVVVLDKSEYAKWQEVMSDNLAKASQGGAQFITAPIKFASGALISVAGLFYAPFETKHHHGDLTRRGLGLAVNGLGDVVVASVAVVDGLTLGGPIYVVALPFTASQAPAKEALKAVQEQQAKDKKEKQE